MRNCPRCQFLAVERHLGRVHRVGQRSLGGGRIEFPIDIIDAYFLIPSYDGVYENIG